MKQATSVIHNPPCEHVLQKLPAYLDNEVTSSEHDAISAHLAQCDLCRAEREHLTALWVQLGQAITPQVPADLSSKIMQRIQDEEAPAAKIRLFRLLPVSAAVAVLGLLVGGWMARTLLEAETNRQGAHDLAAAMDVFAPNPRGTFVSGYLATLENPGRR